jgi:hypothetical protein
LLFVHSLSQGVWAAFLSAVCGFALWRGGRPERLAAAACVVAWLATYLAEDRANWVDPQWGILIVDALLLAVMLWLALTADRLWTLGAAAFQLLAVVTHGAMLADRTMGGWAYMTGGVIFSYLVIASIGVGTWLHWRYRAG